MPIPGFHDMWDDARMTEVIEYLGGCNALSLPEEWLEAIPLNLKDKYGDP